MATTRTASLALASFTPRSYHVGENVVSGVYDGAGLSASGSGMLLMARIPPSSTITGLDAYISSGATTQTLNFGIRSGVSTSVTASAIGQLAKATTGLAASSLPYACTRDEANGETYKFVVASLDTGTVTASCKVNFVIRYTVGQ